MWEKELLKQINEALYSFYWELWCIDEPDKALKLKDAADVLKQQIEMLESFENKEGK